MATRSVKKFFGIFVLAIVGLVLSGCMRFYNDITLSSDDKVSGELTVAILDESVKDLPQGSPDEVWAKLRPEFKIPFDVDETPYKKDGHTGSVFAFKDISLDQWNEVQEDMLIVREGDEFVVTGEISATLDVEGLHDNDQADALSTDARLSITFPGKVIEHNDTLSGRTVTWTADSDHPAVPVSARGSAIEETGFPWLWIGVGLGVLILGLIVVLLLRRPKAQPSNVQPYPGYMEDQAGRDLRDQFGG